MKESATGKPPPPPPTSYFSRSPDPGGQCNQILETKDLQLVCSYLKKIVILGIFGESFG